MFCISWCNTKIDIIILGAWLLKILLLGILSGSSPIDVL